LDGLSRPPIKDKLPEGIYYIGNLVKKATGANAVIHGWHHDHHNNCWILKPDSSCGIEVCSPVSKGWLGVKNVCKTIETLAADKKVAADTRCSFHVHIEVGDLRPEQLASVIAWWVKCEPVFMDSVPSKRKRNRYCQFMGLTDIFDHDTIYSPETLIKRVGHTKYCSLNTFHKVKAHRDTIEFRIMENDCCVNAFMAKNWIRLLIHFVERAAARPFPVPYEEGNRWSSWLWLDPMDVFEVLGFRAGQYQLSDGLAQTRDWFMQRLLRNTSQTGLPGVMSDYARSIAYSQVKELVDEVQYSGKSVNREEALYGKKFRI
jgi:hypothetical protein